MGRPFYDYNGITIYNDDCLNILPQLKADSFDLIFVDWPYFKVKDEPWDRQWNKPGLFLEWIGQTLEQAQRLLKPNGSFYGCASPQMARQVEARIGEYFNVLNTIRWYKEDGWHKKTEKESLRQYLNPWEAIVFAEQYSADGYAKGEAGYTAKCDQLRGFVFEPLRTYLEEERNRAGLTTQDVAEAWRIKTGNTNRTGQAGHWFSQVQWTLPTEDNYQWLRQIFSDLNHGNDYLRREYEDLRREYEDLRREYEDLRRPFNGSPDTPHTDLWTFAPVKDYPGKHPTEKPIAMLEHIISISTRPGTRVLDFCMGNGTTLKAAQNLGREAVGIDIVGAYCQQTVNRLSAVSLFEPAVIQRMVTGIKTEQVAMDFGD